MPAVEEFLAQTKDMEEPEITEGIAELELDPQNPGSLLAKRCQDPVDGFDLDIADGRVTTRFTLDEAIKLRYFIDALILTANKQIVRIHKEMKKQPVSDGPKGLFVGAEEDVTSLVTGVPPSQADEEGSTPDKPFMQE